MPRTTKEDKEMVWSLMSEVENILVTLSNSQNAKDWENEELPSVREITFETI